MFEYRIRIIVVLALLSLPLRYASVVSAETWRLDQGRDWKAISTENQDKYLLAVAEIKQMAEAGQSQAVQKKLNQLKKDFPKVAGPDLDAFIKAETLFSKGKFTKAVRSYDKFLEDYPASELYQAALDREFAIGTAYLGGQKKTVLGIFKIKGYAEGEKIMEKISDRAGNSPLALKAAQAVANSYEKRGMFNDAYRKWSEISSKWPTGEIGKNALLNMARCKHAAYKGPKYDASNLISARSYYENFKLRYTAEAERLDIDKIIGQINEQLAYKQFSVGQYYQKTGSKQAANFYYQMVVDNWPESTSAKMVKKVMN